MDTEHKLPSDEQQHYRRLLSELAPDHPSYMSPCIHLVSQNGMLVAETELDKEWATKFIGKTEIGPSEVKDAERKAWESNCNVTIDGQGVNRWMADKAAELQLGKSVG